MKLGKLLALCCFSLLIKSHAMGDTAPQPLQYALESPAKCSVKNALKALKKQLNRYPVPKGDGTAPWADLYGAWVNQERGVVVVFKGEHVVVDGKSRDLIRTRIYHLCNSGLIAEGSRYIEKADYNAEGLSIRLKRVDASLPYPYFDAYFTVIKGRSAPMYVDTQMISPKIDNHRLNDRFKLHMP